jgi:hypothetical protein
MVRDAEGESHLPNPFWAAYPKGLFSVSIGLGVPSPSFGAPTQGQFFPRRRPLGALPRAQSAGCQIPNHRGPTHLRPLDLLNTQGMQIGFESAVTPASLNQTYSGVLMGLCTAILGSLNVAPSCFARRVKASTAAK